MSPFDPTGMLVLDASVTEGLKALKEILVEKEKTNRRSLELKSERDVAMFSKASDAICHMSDLIQDYCKTVEEEQTKRLNIEAIKATTLQKLNFQKEVILTYLEKDCNRRDKVIEGLFKGIEKVLDQNDSDNKVKMLGMFLDSLNTQIKEPLMQIAFANPKGYVQQMMTNDKPEEF